VIWDGSDGWEELSCGAAFKLYQFGGTRHVDIYVNATVLASGCAFISVNSPSFVVDEGYEVRIVSANQAYGGGTVTVNGTAYPAKGKGTLNVTFS
jgi:hypothetical protein